MSERTSPMPRMREAMRSAWKGSSASSFSPVPAKRIGLPATVRRDRAAPPRASPSILVSTIPETGRRPAKPCAVATASCPVIASATRRTWRGVTEIEAARSLAEQADELAMNEPQEVLLGGEAAQHFLTERVPLDRFDEVPDDLQVDVGLEERQAHVAERVLDVPFGDPSLSLQLAQQGIELLRESFEHDQGSPVQAKSGRYKKRVQNASPRGSKTPGARLRLEGRFAPPTSCRPCHPCRPAASPPRRASPRVSPRPSPPS